MTGVPPGIAAMPGDGEWERWLVHAARCHTCLWAPAPRRGCGQGQRLHAEYRRVRDEGPERRGGGRAADDATGAGSVALPAPGRRNPVISPR